MTSFGRRYFTTKGTNNSLSFSFRGMNKGLYRKEVLDMTIWYCILSFIIGMGYGVLMTIDKVLECFDESKEDKES